VARLTARDQNPCRKVRGQGGIHLHRYGDGHHREGHCCATHRLCESLVRYVDRTQVSGRQQGRSLRKTQAGVLRPLVCSFQFPPPDPSAPAVESRCRESQAETAQIFSTSSPAQYLGRWNFNDQVTCGRGSNSVAERAKKQVAGMKALLRRRASKSLEGLQEPPNTDASC
jgi:hypothetical protein